jgi:hypothetical protein
MSPPSSRPPAGLPDSSGNAKYAIVAVVLLLGAGGLFAWRSLSSKDNTPPPPPLASASASASAQATTNPLLDDIPPPPPVDTTPEAGKPNVVYVPTGGGCDGKCAGSPPPELSQVVQVRAAQARRCYNQALSQDSSLRGHVSVALRVGPAGNVCSASVASNDMGSPSVAQCAANVMRAGSYPAPRGGCVDVSVPFSFVPMGQ